MKSRNDALAIGVFIFVVGTILWLKYNHQIPPPPPSPTITVSQDPEVLLCDIVVRRFLASTTVVEVTRDIEIIKQLNCDITKRAQNYQ
jgi:hypothetical protein